MASQKINIGPGKTKMGELVEIEKSSEPWAEYQLSDGTIFKIKIVMSEIWRLDGEFDAAGNPTYFFKAAPLTSVRAPDELKRKEH
jgi:hypothetical protein